MSTSFYLHTDVAGLNVSVGSEEGVAILGHSPDPEGPAHRSGRRRDDRPRSR